MQIPEGFQATPHVCRQRLSAGLQNVCPSPLPHGGGGVGLRMLIRSSPPPTYPPCLLATELQSWPSRCGARNGPAR